MEVISISPSMLDTYRRATNGQYIESGDQLEQEIIGPRVTNEAMSRGTAFHLLIENGPRAYVDQAAKLLKVPEPELGVTWEFDYSIGVAVKELLDKTKGIQHEVKDLIKFDLAGVQVFMPLRVDGLLLDEVKEFKTKGSTPNYMDYFDSLQWRCYLVAFPDCQTVGYHVYHLGKNNNLLGVYGYQMRRYETVKEDVEKALNGFIEWAKTRPLVWEHLKSRASGYADL